MRAKPPHRRVFMQQRPNAPCGVRSRPPPPAGLHATTPSVGPDVRRHATVPPSWIQRENWEFETHRRQSVHALVHKRLNRGLKISQLSKRDRVFGRMRAVRTFYKFGDVTDPAKGRFTRLPVILRLERKGKITEIMIVHTKSKFSTLRKPSQWEKKDKDAIISAILARQKLSLEMNVIRKYIAYRLYSRKAEGIVVMGDMNDGVTRDIVDESYLLHSIVHELRGAFHHELALMRHVLSGKQLQRKGSAWTVEFKDPVAGGKNTRVLLDHIIFSPACHAGGKIRYIEDSGHIEHRAFNRHVVNKGRSRDDRPSDHVPVSARFALL